MIPSSAPALQTSQRHSTSQSSFPFILSRNSFIPNRNNVFTVFTDTPRRSATSL